MSIKENNNITEIDSETAAPETDKKTAETLMKATPAKLDRPVTGRENSTTESSPAKPAGKKTRKTVKKSSSAAENTADSDRTFSADTEPAAPAKKKRTARKTKSETGDGTDAPAAKKTTGRKKKETAKKTAEKSDAAKPASTRRRKAAVKDTGITPGTDPAAEIKKADQEVSAVMEAAPAVPNDTDVKAAAAKEDSPAVKSAAEETSASTEVPAVTVLKEVLPAVSEPAEEKKEISTAGSAKEEVSVSTAESKPEAGSDAKAPEQKPEEKKTEEKKTEEKKTEEKKPAENKPDEKSETKPEKKTAAETEKQDDSSKPVSPEKKETASAAGSSPSAGKTRRVISAKEANRRIAEGMKKESKKESRKDSRKESKKESGKDSNTPSEALANPLTKPETKTETKPEIRPNVSSSVKPEPFAIPAPIEKQNLNFGLAGKILLGLFTLVLILAVAAGFGGFMFYQSLLENMPALDISKREQYSQASKIYDKDGAFVAEYGTNENVEWADSEEIPQMLKDAFIAIEDERFYTHNGIDLKRLTGAVIGQITGNSSYGASTITQQLIKNTHLSQEVTYTRKAQEIHLAMELEEVMTKDEILVWYMNTLYLGDSNYGVKVAAKDYFGKELNELSLRECAILAGLAQSPNEYNPRLNMLKGDIAPTNKRIANVLYKMLETGKINEEQYEAALNSHLSVLRNSRRYKLYDYPIYVEYAVENVATKLLNAEGVEVNDDSLNEKKQFLRGAGYNIYTAFDRNIQDISQDAIQNFDKYPSTVTGTQVEVSTVIMDQRKGTVVAMVGGREEAKEPEGFNRATDSTQAVGSSIKPLSVYAPACETGDYPGTTVLDVQSSIEGYGEDNSYPNGDHTGGAITMRKALELSHNIPAARFLLEHVGIDRSYDFMVEEGFAVDNLAKTPAGLALGATDVTTLEMTAAYACLANGGEYIEPHAYTKVTDRFGNVLLDANKEIERHTVFSKSTAWLVTDMMESNMREGYGVNARLTDVPSAGKTGTHEHQVISFGGYSPYYTSFLRISADDYVRMINSSSYYQSAALWKAYMDPIHEGLETREIQDFTKEDVGIQQYYVCDNSGKLAESWCSGHYEYAAPGNAPTEKCDGHTYGTGQSDWSEWDQESNYNNYNYNYSEPAINYDDPEWWLHGWWDEQGNFHPE